MIAHGQDIRNALGMGCLQPLDTIELALAGIHDDEMRADYRRHIAG